MAARPAAMSQHKQCSGPYLPYAARDSYRLRCQASTIPGGRVNPRRQSWGGSYPSRSFKGRGVFCKRAANQTVLYRTTRDDTGRHQADLRPVQDNT